MNNHDESSIARAVRHRIRRSAAGTAVGAGLLMFFGFAYLVRPEGTDLFSQASLAVYYAARIGGVVSAVIAVWLWSGHRPALIVDGAVAVTLGVTLAAAGGVMVVDGGDALQAAIIAFCGMTFVSSGVRNGRAYFALAARDAAITQQRRSSPERKSRREGACVPSSVAVNENQSAEVVNWPKKPKEERSTDSGAATGGDSTEGYLAALGRAKPPGHGS